MARILLFAGFREAVRENEIAWSETPITVADLKAKLQQQYPEFPTLDHVMVAVNEQFADGDTEIQEGDTVALIPPVSGG